jgi:hypothetical protein
VVFICFLLEPVDSAAKILDWLLEQIEGDAIEDVTDEMLEKLVSGHLAGNGYCESKLVLFLFPPSFFTYYEARNMKDYLD